MVGVLHLIVPVLLTFPPFAFKFSVCAVTLPTTNAHTTISCRCILEDCYMNSHIDLEAQKVEQLRQAGVFFYQYLFGKAF